MKVYVGVLKRGNLVVAISPILPTIGMAADAVTPPPGASMPPGVDAHVYYFNMYEVPDWRASLLIHDVKPESEKEH